MKRLFLNLKKKNAFHTQSFINNPWHRLVFSGPSCPKEGHQFNPRQGSFCRTFGWASATKIMKMSFEWGAHYQNPPKIYTHNNIAPEKLLPIQAVRRLLCSFQFQWRCEYAGLPSRMARVIYLALWIIIGSMHTQGMVEGGSHEYPSPLTQHPELYVILPFCPPLTPYYIVGLCVKNLPSELRPRRPTDNEPWMLNQFVNKKWVVL